MSRERIAAIADLVEAGHSPTKALEIAVEAERGDEISIEWIAGIRRHLAKLEQSQ